MPRHYPHRRDDLDSLRDAAATLKEPLSPVIYQIESAVEFKRRLVLGYASQIDDETGTLITDFATRYGGGERLWANQPWVDALR